MNEFYNLPVLYTKEEADQYAKWGLRKAKLLVPFSYFIFFMDIFVTLGTIVWCICYAFHSPYNSYLLRILVSKFSYAICIILTIFVYLPLNYLFDILFQKPHDPMTLRLEPSSNGMLYQLLRKKQILSKGILPWDDWPTKIFPETNEIIINQQKLKIGKNTIDSIYPKDKRKPWLDRPSEKIVGTIQLDQIQKNMVGYFASLEEKEKEKNWERTHI